ncbi:hypothetical protein LTR95_009363 [Oleoguttula sp. CCFEE 5521]
MSWAAYRDAARREDVAYSLFGLLDVNLPLLYGEGNRAFVRLQEELIRTTPDLSTLAWGLHKPVDLLADAVSESILFARTPDDFSGCGDVIFTGRLGSPARLEHVGLVVNLPIVFADRAQSMADVEDASDYVLAHLGCTMYKLHVCLILRPRLPMQNNGQCTTQGMVCLEPGSCFAESKMESFLIVRDRTLPQPEPVRAFSYRASVQIQKSADASIFQVITLTDAFPRQQWNLSTRAMSHLLRQEPSGYRRISHVGGLTLNAVDGSSVHLVFRMIRPALRTHDAQLGDAKADTHWASFFPDMTLRRACNFVKALQYRDDRTLENALRKLGPGPALRYDFGKTTVQAFITSGLHRSLNIEIICSRSRNPAQRTAGADTSPHRSTQPSSEMSAHQRSWVPGRDFDVEDIEQALSELNLNHETNVPKLMIIASSPDTSPRMGLRVLDHGLDATDNATAYTSTG